MTLKNFLEIPYDELEQLNLEAKQRGLTTDSNQELTEHYLRYLAEEKRIKAVTVAFSDLEGCLHTLDYDKKYLLNSHNNLTFDGSSIRGFSNVSESDLRLAVDWSSFRWLPSDVFGPGKVIVFGLIQSRKGETYSADFRGRLKEYLKELKQRYNYSTQVAVECEGFLFRNLSAEQYYTSHSGFELVSTGGYFSSLPQDPLKLFIDNLAEVQRALSFENEKDHPEVAPSQFELNYRYCNALLAADQVQLYKLTARQIAASAGLTASFLPKPVAGINGSGMHCNLSLAKEGRNLFYDRDGEFELSSLARDFIERLLVAASELSLVFNSSVNAYRRLDPTYEAPNQIRVSAVDRTAMLRIPAGNEASTRVEMRSVAPDCNPYLTFYSLLRTGIDGQLPRADTEDRKRPRTRVLPAGIYDAIRLFKASEWCTELMGPENKDKYIQCKLASAHRCPRELGKIVKTEEILFHHEVTNQYLWSRF